VLFIASYQHNCKKVLRKTIVLKLTTYFCIDLHGKKLRGTYLIIATHLYSDAVT